MLDAHAIANGVAAHALNPEVVATVRDLCARELAPIVRKIDAEGYYPESIMRAFGRAGAFACHLPEKSKGRADLVSAIRAMAAAGEHCLSTAFCMWCQDALGWYIYASDNEGIKVRLGRHVAAGEVLGGTALSNPMKVFFGIEPIRLKGKRINGGYLLRGALPFVSNLGADHYFGAVFEVDGEPSHYVMAVIPCAAEGVSLSGNNKFVALDGTRTFAVGLRDVNISDDWILADPSDAYIRRIRAGFVLLQAGMAFGLISGCVDLMERVRGPLGHVNKFLDVQPERLTEQLIAMQAETERLAATPFETDQAYWRRVIQARLTAGEAAVAAAHAAMLHCGARGYVTTGAAQRRLRESYFVAIVTPAIKQLKKMLADMAH
jgi:alkylation response protein AidB-like acyl-CoA dehydrogenase